MMYALSFPTRKYHYIIMQFEFVLLLGSYPFVHSPVEASSPPPPDSYAIVIPAHWTIRPLKNAA
jgi:hypothetical protein